MLRLWIAILAVVIYSTIAWSGSSIRRIEWPILVDPDAQSFDDPFKKLSYRQLAQLASVVRERERVKLSGLTHTDRTESQRRLTSALSALGDDGIDIDALIGLRWVVADRRRRAASAGNSELDGAIVRIAGFTIPAGRDDQGTQIAYLVPERGMCSHTPPPSPNQLIRVRMTADWKPTRLYELVRLTGRLSLAPSRERIRIVDGLVAMNATYRLEATRIETPASAASAYRLKKQQSLTQ